MSRKDRQDLAARVAVLLVTHQDERAVAAALSSGKFKIPPDDVGFYIDEARRLIHDTLDIEADDHLAKTLFRLDHIYESACQTQDYKTAILAIEKICKLLDLPGHASSRRKAHAPGPAAAPVRPLDGLRLHKAG